ncbi:hypothetical protein [Rhizobium leguminosarum]|uniref:hypothetical protein n=1 Tax=Rhizobium leguminosarum TaxID=384 RepID=UPI001C9591B8|nr:hypothetical protein [Rhizobium leguminosarum]MBY5431018.1 site-specific integrase [Rhizobium leguminosarum]
MAVALKVPAGSGKTEQRDDRFRQWLGSSYLDDTWILLSSLGNGDPVTVTFRVVMPDGRLLIDHPKLYATAKEFSYWVRAAEYARVDDAATHASYVNAIIRICMAVVNLGYTSFADLQKSDVDDICSASAFGTGAMLNIADRLGDYLAQYRRWADVPSNEKILKRRRGEQGELIPAVEFNRKAVLAACNIPDMIARPVTKQELVAATARLNGTTVVSFKALRTGPVSSPNIIYTTSTFEALYRLRNHMEADPLPFLPFEEGASERATALGRESEVTPIVPADLMMSMLDKTFRFLTDNADQIIQNHREAVARRLGVDTYDHAFAVSCRQAVTKLVTACFIVIAAFSARRADEIQALQRECLDGDDKNGWWLKVYIEKSIRSIAAIPIPRVVAFAVKTMKQLSVEDAPSEDALLFTYFDPVLGREVGTMPERKLNDFAEQVEAVSYTSHEGKAAKWHWTSRQFRRFFAILFFYRYKGKKQSIAHHLRHFSMETTSGYLRLDPVFDRLWLEELRNFQKWTVTNIVSGAEKAAGPMGEIIKAEAARLRTIFNDVIKIHPERLADMVLDRLDKNHVLFTPKAWATCCCPNTKSATRRAACQRACSTGVSGLGPNFSEAGPSICPGCPWAILNEENADFMDKEILELREATEHLEHPTWFQELQLEKLIVLTSQRKTVVEALG